MWCGGGLLASERPYTAAALIPTIASRQQYVIKRNWWLSIEEALKREFARSEMQ